MTHRQREGRSVVDHFEERLWVPRCHLKDCFETSHLPGNAHRLIGQDLCLHPMKMHLDHEEDKLDGRKIVPRAPLSWMVTGWNAQNSAFEGAFSRSALVTDFTRHLRDHFIGEF